MNTINTLNGVILASRGEVTEHAENPTVHLTEEERIVWNAKADAAQLDAKADAATFTAHENNQTVHVSEEEKEKWNARTTKGVVAATQDGLDEHAGNTTVHVTDAERTSWNEKAEVADITWEQIFVAGDSQTATLPVGSKFALTDTNDALRLALSGEEGPSFYCPAQTAGYQYTLSITPNSVLMAYVNTDDVSKRHGFTVTPEGSRIVGAPLIVPDGTEGAHAINKAQLDDAITRSSGITREQMEAYIEEYIAAHVPASPVDLSDYRGPIRLCDENGKEVLVVTQDDGEQHIFIGGKGKIDVQDEIITVLPSLYVGGRLDAGQIKSYQYTFPDSVTGGYTHIGISYDIDNNGIVVNSGEKFSVLTSGSSNYQGSTDYLTISPWGGVEMMGSHVTISSGALELYERDGSNTKQDGVLGLTNGQVQYNY